MLQVHGLSVATVAACLSVVGVVLSTVLAPSLRASLSAGLAARTALTSADSPAYASWASSDNSGAATVIVSYTVYNVTNPVRRFAAIRLPHSGRVKLRTRSTPAPPRPAAPPAPIPSPPHRWTC